MKELLKVGDKLYLERYSYGRLTQMKFSSVTRLTKTRAILDTGESLQNELSKIRNNFDGITEYCELENPNHLIYATNIRLTQKSEVESAAEKHSELQEGNLHTTT